jgi:hypothetical protein
MHSKLPRSRGGEMWNGMDVGVVSAVPVARSRACGGIPRGKNRHSRSFKQHWPPQLISSRSQQIPPVFFWPTSQQIPFESC